jgi:hypothetical protein
MADRDEIVAFWDQLLDAICRLGELAAERFGTEHQFIEVPNPV